MNRFLIIIALLALQAKSFAQSTHMLQPFFIGMVVENVDSTSAWYVDHLGFEVYRSDEVPEYGVKAKFLKIPGFQIEMFQHKDAFEANDFIPESKNPVLKRGYTKFGFLVNNIDELYDNFESKEYPIYLDLMEDEKFGYRFFMVKDYSGNTIQIFEKMP